MYKNRTDNKEALKNTCFKNFTDKVGTRASEQFATELYNRFTVEDFEYSDDHKYFNVVAYFNEKVVPHKIAVYQAGIELMRNDWFKDFIHHETDEFEWNLWAHDMSKFSANEAFGYAFYNFKTKAGKERFEEAWHHHKTNNPHHPEYWLNPNRSGVLEPMPMPEIYIAEMIADWIGAGKTYGNTLDAWLPDNIHKFVFHPKTSEKVYFILTKLGFKAWITENLIFTTQAD